MLVDDANRFVMNSFSSVEQFAGSRSTKTSGVASVAVAVDVVVVVVDVLAGWMRSALLRPQR